MTVELEYFRKAYARSLKAYLNSGSEEALQVACELGRAAGMSDVQPVDLAGIYQETLRTLLERKIAPRQEVSLVQAAGTFFMESLASLEMTLRSLQEANHSLVLLNERLRDANDALEEQVRDRTAKLGKSVYLLRQEVSRRQQAQQALCETEAQYRRLVELSPTPTMVVAAGHFLYVSPAAARLLAAENAAELNGAPLSTVLMPEAVDAVLRDIQQMLDQESEREPLEAKLVCLDGSIVDVEITATAILYDGQSAVQLVCYDVTEWKLAEQAEREQRSVAEALAQSAAQLNKTLKFDEVLERALISIERVLPHDGANIMLLEDGVAHIVRCRGYRSAAEREDIIGVQLSIEDITALRVMWETGEPVVVSDTSSDPNWLRVPPTQWIRSYVAAPIKVKGETIAFLNADSATPYSFKREHAERLKAFADQVALAMQNARLYEKLSNYSASLEQAVQERTQELEAAKNRLETILDSVGDALLVLDENGCIEQVNPAFEAQTGYTAAEVVHRHWTDFLPELVLENLQREFAGTFSPDAVWRDEIKIPRKGGTLYDAAITVAPLFDSQGKAAGHVAALVDVSPLKEVARMKDSFVANVSHELRTPITSLKLNHSLAKLNGAKAALYLERVGRDIDRLNTLIEDLLRLSRLEQGRVELDMQVLDPIRLARQYVDDRQSLAKNRELALTFNAGPETPLVEADAGLLEQVVSIFVTNALNYTPTGGEIEVSTCAKHSGNQLWAGISVRDSGPGLTAEDKTHLFERFYRGKIGRNAGVPGTGLGLNIALEIVSRHDGHIEVQSEGVPGKGSTFTVWLHAADERAAAEHRMHQFIERKTSKYFSTQ